MSMNRAAISELECFIAVAEELNFSRAASRLHLSQPPLSRQIQSLEAKLGVRLLNRNTRTVALTAAGSLYLDDVRHILTRLDSAASSAHRAGTGESLRLRLAFVGALMDESLVEVLQTFRKLHPTCQIHLSDLPPSAQLEALLVGQVDGAFIGASPQKPQKAVSTLIWKREPLLLVLPEHHALATSKSVSLLSLKEESWVMVSRSAAPAFRQQFDRLCAEATIRPRVVQESERAAAVLMMVAAEQGVSLLPESVSRLVHPGVVFLRVTGMSPTLDHTYAYRDQGDNALLADFRRLLSTALRT
jgi:DNA-binding transcriptional LysR family regulator